MSRKQCEKERGHRRVRCCVLCQTNRLWRGSRFFSWFGRGALCVTDNHRMRALRSDKHLHVLCESLIRTCRREFALRRCYIKKNYICHEPWQMSKKNYVLANIQSRCSEKFILHTSHFWLVAKIIFISRSTRFLLIDPSTGCLKIQFQELHHNGLNKTFALILQWFTNYSSAYSSILSSLINYLSPAANNGYALGSAE